MMTRQCDAMSAEFKMSTKILDTSRGLKPIHLAILADNYEAVKQLLNNSATDVNSRANGVSCLIMAASQSTLPIVRELLKRRDLDVNAVLSQDDQVTALMAAVCKGPDYRPASLRAEIVDLLARDSRCDIQLTDENNYTALTYATHLGNVLVVKQLLKNGRAAKYSVDELLGDCQVAMKSNHEGICDLILESLSVAQKVELLRKLDSAKG